jgi:hypothetical protein
MKPENGVITYNGMLYRFEYRLAKDGDLCLATENPYRYCNGTYAYSSKDPGDGKAFVVTNYITIINQIIEQNSNNYERKDTYDSC